VPSYKIGDLAPQIDASAYICPGAHVIGNVHLKANSSVWFGAVLRGDNEPIHIGERSNVQEGAVLHVDQGCPLTVGNDVTVGHQAMLHGCTIGNGSLIGIQAVILNRAVIGEDCLIGAGALISEGKVIPARSVVMGAPGKIVRQLTDDEIANMRIGNAHYVAAAALYASDLKEIS
jgi:carbonic anhydrase/acetyltransferase-like protein (isoleucine patch superfamily)